MSNCLQILKQKYDSMTPVEKKIAACILEAPESVLNETISHLAQRAGTSSGSVTNFAASMGFFGFADLKIKIAQSLQRVQTPSFDGVNSTDDPRMAMKKIMQAAHKAFEETLDAMGDELLEAAGMLMNARRIEIYASGSSLPLGHDVHYRLMRLGLPAVILPDPLLACMSASQLTKKDVAFVISHKGRTTNTLEAAEMAQKHGAKVLALTSYAESPLARMSDTALVSVSSEAVAYREAVISRLTQLVIVDGLCAYIAAQNGMEAMRHLDNEIEVLEQYRQSDKEENK